MHELIGAVVIDQDGVERGTVSEVHDNPASDLLVLDTDVLVPVTFVTGFDPDAEGGSRITVDAPKGLFDLE